MQFSIIEIPTKKNFKYFSIFFLILLFFQLISSALANYINPDLTMTSLSFNSLEEEFFVVVILSPVIETLIFQYAVIETLLNLKVRAWICIVVSGLLFGIQHWYNLVYIAVLTMVGFILAYYYLALSKQRALNSIFLLIIIHSLFNMIAFFIKNF